MGRQEEGNEHIDDHTPSESGRVNSNLLRSTGELFFHFIDTPPLFQSIEIKNLHEMTVGCLQWHPEILFSAAPVPRPFSCF